ncbi:MAG: hypothetical protein ACMG6H_04530, partial [Acidobacteriota bacterium]
MKDLVILVADKNMQFALKGALGRFEALAIRPIEFDFLVHPGRDGGARKSGSELLRLEHRRFTKALLVLDFEGSGTDLPDGQALEAELDQQLTAQWGDSAKAIVIEPELEVWIWGTDNAIQAAINWPRDERIREWLREEGYAFDDNDKPKRPKEALEATLRVAALPRSSAVYQE